jgi:hypothetical protein
MRETYVLRGGRLVAKRSVEPLPRRASAPMILRDTEPYRSIAVDVATGARALIGGRAQHREFLRRNNYVEVGNAYVAPRREELTRTDRIADIRGALQD